MDRLTTSALPVRACRCAVRLRERASQGTWRCRNRGERSGCRSRRLPASSGYGPGRYGRVPDGRDWGGLTGKPGTSQTTSEAGAAWRGGPSRWTGLGAHQAVGRSASFGGILGRHAERGRHGLPEPSSWRGTTWMHRVTGKKQTWDWRLRSRSSRLGPAMRTHGPAGQSCHRRRGPGQCCPRYTIWHRQQPACL